MHATTPKSPTREHVARLPVRRLLSVVDPSLTNGLLAYTNGGSSPTDLTATNPVPGGLLNSAVQSAQNSSAQQNGASVQNIDSPGALGYATATSP
jgi:hypothetical protein